MPKVVEAPRGDLEFSVKAKAFRSAFQIVSNTLDKRPDSAGSVLYLEAVNRNGSPRVLLFSSNSSHMSTERIPAEVKGEGSIVVAPSLLRPLISSLNDDDTITFSRLKTAVRLKVTAGSSKITMPTGNPTWLGSLLRGLPFTDKGILTLPAFKLREVIERTSLFAYKGEDNYALQNVLIGTRERKLEAFSTNRLVIAHAWINGLEDSASFEVALPGQAVDSLRKILSRLKDSGDEKAMLRLIMYKTPGGSEWFYIRTPDGFYGSSLTGDKMPDLRPHLSKLITGSEVMVSREAMLASLKRVEPFCEASYKSISLMATSAGLNIRGWSQVGENQELVPLSRSFDGTASAIISADHLRNALTGSKEDMITIDFLADKSVIRLHSGNGQTGEGSYLMATQKEG